MKKVILEKIMLGILTFILIIYIGFGLIIFSSFNISKKFLNKDNVSDFINNVDVINILKNELGNELTEFAVLEEDFNKIGITEESLNNFINSEDVKDFSNNIIINVYDKLFKQNNVEYQITNEEVSSLIKNNIDKLETNSNLSSDDLMNKIEKKIPNLVLNINDLLDKLYNKLENSEIFQKYQNYIYSSLNIFDIIYSDIILGLMIFVIISFIILLIYIRKSFYKSLKWISISFIIPTIVFSIISTIIYTFIRVDSLLIDNILSIVNNNLIKHSIIYFIISLVFCIINVIMYVIRKYKKKVSNG